MLKLVVVSANVLLANRKEGIVLQKRDDPEEKVLKRLEQAKPEDIDHTDYRWLMQRFYDLSACGSPQAKRVKAILKKFASHSSNNDTANQ